MSENKIDWTKPVQTKDGRSVRILCTDGPGDYPVIGIVKNKDYCDRWTLGGCLYATGEYCPTDLQNAPEKRKLEGFLNVYKDEAHAYSSKTTADTMASKTRIACIDLSKYNIEFEVGEGLK